MIRKLIRSNEYQLTTAGVLQTYQQANLFIIRKEEAYDFERFLTANTKACPLIEKSDEQLGFTDIGSIDIRRDVPKYDVYCNGVNVKSILDLIHEDLTDYVAFTVGCSFSFEYALKQANVPLKHHELGKNVAMYKTSLPCNSVGKFKGNIVVSMRPINRQYLKTVIEITSHFDDAHGIPIHIGDPTLIGIKSLERPDFGDYIEVSEDEVPVFWGCGVTATEVLKNCLKSKFYTHSPGHMLITYLKNNERFNPIESLHGILLNHLERRRMAGLTYYNDIMSFSKNLLAEKSILLLTGFPIGNVGETDGPLSMFLAKSLKDLGKQIVVMTDKSSLVLLSAINDAFNMSIDIRCVQEKLPFQPSCILAVERPGKAEDGNYYSMRGACISHFVSDSDKLVKGLMANGVSLYAIGDGGNELGLGLYKDYVSNYVKHGKKIAAEIKGDHVLVAGVSNWGSACVEGMLSILSGENRMSSPYDIEKALRIIVSLGAVDGVTKKSDLTVDDIDLIEHKDIVLKINQIVEEALKNK